MAITLEIGVSHLFPKLFANAFILLCALQSAGTVAAGALQAFPDGGNHFLILIQMNCHGNTSFLRPL